MSAIEGVPRECQKTKVEIVDSGIFFVDLSLSSLLWFRAKLQGAPERKDNEIQITGSDYSVIAFAGSALAQNQLSGTLKCGDKPATEYTVEIGDHPGHVMVLSKGTCAWAAPVEIAGLKSTSHSGSEVTDVDGAKFQARGYAVLTMDNGDKVYVRTQDTGTVKDGGKTMTADGTWSFTGGTGKLKGLKGKGTYKSSGVPDGEANIQVEGEYTLPAAGAAGK